jgi:hypothetical protein
MAPNFPLSVHMTTEMVIATLSAAIALASVAVAYYAFHKTLRTAAKPVLIFSMTSELGWRVENVGVGPAINVLIGPANDPEHEPGITSCYPLAAGATLELAWITNPHPLAAVYSDVYGATFSTICQRHQNRVVNRNLFPQWKPKHYQWMQALLADGKEQSQLTAELLAEKTPTELEIMRNEFYARRGYIFGREDLANYFSQQFWYKPITRDFTTIHRNMPAVERYEAHLILEFQNRHNLRANPISIISSDTRSAGDG